MLRRGQLRDIEIIIGARLESGDEAMTEMEKDQLLQMQAILYSTEVRLPTHTGAARAHAVPDCSGRVRGARRRGRRSARGGGGDFLSAYSEASSLPHSARAVSPISHFLPAALFVPTLCSSFIPRLSTTPSYNYRRRLCGTYGLSALLETLKAHTCGSAGPFESTPVCSSRGRCASFKQRDCLRTDSHRRECGHRSSGLWLP